MNWVFNLLIDARLEESWRLYMQHLGLFFGGPDMDRRHQHAEHAGKVPPASRHKQRVLCHDLYHHGECQPDVEQLEHHDRFRLQRFPRRHGLRG